MTLEVDHLRHRLSATVSIARSPNARHSRTQRSWKEKATEGAGPERGQTLEGSGLRVQDLRREVRMGNTYRGLRFVSR